MTTAVFDLPAVLPKQWSIRALQHGSSELIDAVIYLCHASHEQAIAVLTWLRFA
jgi:hypothetical protein